MARIEDGDAFAVTVVAELIQLRWAAAACRNRVRRAGATTDIAPSRYRLIGGS